MSETPARIALPGSERHPIPGARITGATPPAEQLTVTVYVRPNPNAPPLPSPEAIGAQLPQERHYLSDTEFAQAYGADPADLAKVAAFAQEYGLIVEESSEEKRSVRLSGTVEAMQRAFGVELHTYQATEETYRGRAGSVLIPAELEGIVQAVFGLDNRRVGKSRLRRAKNALAPAHAVTDNRYFPYQAAQLYNFPANTDGQGQTVGIFAFNDTSVGGYSLTALNTYFSTYAHVPTPSITDVVVHGQGNVPGPDDPNQDPYDSTGEIMLDIQMVGSVAPKAKIVMYFTAFTEQGWVDAIHAAITDTKNNPKVISISYGNPEDDPQGAWTQAAITQVDMAFSAAAAKGITICCASGDDGSRDQASDTHAHTDYPASSAYVLGCGGTRVNSTNNVITSEVVWNDGAGYRSGGGVSSLFPVPAWQQSAGVPPSANPGHKRGRGVPDVSALARNVVIIHVSGQTLDTVDGTSASAPLWAGLMARLNQKVGTPIGFFNPLLYTRFAKGVLRDITSGNNGAYKAGPGWDACTGLGSPDGTKLAQALTSQSVTPHAPTPATSGDGTQPADTTASLQAQLEQERAERRLLLETFAATVRLLDKQAS